LDAGVAAFALPSTCEPEGYTAERAKGHVRLLPPHGSARFGLSLGHLDAAETVTAAATVAALASRSGDPA